MKEIKGLGDRLRTQRNAKGITQETLAELCEVSVGTIKGAEAGKRAPDLSTMAAICNKLDIGLDYIVFGDNPPKPPQVDLNSISFAAQILSALPKLNQVQRAFVFSAILNDPKYILELPDDQAERARQAFEILKKV